MTICYPLPACDWLKNISPSMTLSGYFMSKSVFGKHFFTQSVWHSKITAWKVTKHRPMLSATEMYINYSSFWRYKLFLDIRKRFSDYCRQTDAISTQVSEIMSTLLYIMTTIRFRFLLTAITMTLNDVECPIRGRHAVIIIKRYLLVLYTLTSFSFIILSCIIIIIASVEFLQILILNGCIA